MSIGKATTDSKTLQGYVSQASNIAVVLDSGKCQLNMMLMKINMYYQI